jgi:hypothetical protein
MAVDIYRRIFVYSRQQQEDKMNIDRKMGRNSKFGTVIVNGVPKTYTDIVTNMSKCKFSDSIIVCTGDIRKIKFEAPSTY